MAETTSGIIKTILIVLPEICVILSTLPIMGVVISLNPDVKWNSYKDDPYGLQMYAQYSHTLWSSEDPSSYIGKATSGEYLTILKPRDGASDAWKTPVKHDLYLALGLTCGCLFVLILSLVVHTVTKEKFFTIILMMTFSAVGSASGYFMENARKTFKDGLHLAIATQAKDYYKENNNEEKLGSHLVHYTAIVLLVGCGINLVNVGLFASFGDGKWIWQRKKQTEVIPIRKLSII